MWKLHRMTQASLFLHIECNKIKVHIYCLKLVDFYFSVSLVLFLFFEHCDLNDDSFI